MLLYGWRDQKFITQNPYHLLDLCEKILTVTTVVKYLDLLKKSLNVLKHE
jgi:hypothetical protein